MSSATDMSTPVTRGELREQLEKLATKADLEMWGGALLARIESGEQRLLARIESGEQRLLARIESGEQRLTERIDQVERQLTDRIDQVERQLTERIDQVERQLTTDLARHTTANYESMLATLAVIDEKYADLPGRVKRLEATGRAPER